MIGNDEFVSRLNQGSRFRISRSDRADSPETCSLLPPPEKAAGQLHGYFHDQNLGLTIRNLRPKCEFSDEQIGLGRMVFLLHLSGRRRIEISGQKHQLFEPTLAIFYHPLGLSKRSVWSYGADELSLTIGMWPQGLASLGEFSSSGLPDMSSMGRNQADSFWYARPLPYSMIAATENLFNKSIDPCIAKTYISAKSTEIVCLSLNALLSDGKFLSRRDVAEDRVERIKALIDSSLTNPPSLSDLSGTFRVSVQDLAHEIRTETGVSLAKYITNRRMARARVLLEAGSLPMKQVAYEVGYGHTSNFCTAFKRHFGKPPKSLVRYYH